MTREELIGINAGIVKTVVENVLKFSPDTIMWFLILWIL
jgi:malate dehydrogenase